MKINRKDKRPGVTGQTATFSKGEGTNNMAVDGAGAQADFSTERMQIANDDRVMDASHAMVFGNVGDDRFAVGRCTGAPVLDGQYRALQSAATSVLPKASLSSGSTNKRSRAFSTVRALQNCHMIEVVNRPPEAGRSGSSLSWPPWPSRTRTRHCAPGMRYGSLQPLGGEPGATGSGRRQPLASRSAVLTL